MSKKYKITPEYVLSIIIDFDGISLAVTKEQEIFNLFFINTYSQIHSKLDEHIIKQKLMYKINSIFEEYPIDTLLLEQEKLTIDKIDRYPDPYILSNILLKYSVHISIEDSYLQKVKYFMEIPIWDWTNTIFNKKARYTIDLYKNHILTRGLIGSEEIQEEVKLNNYYKVLCFSECSLYPKLMDKKYQLNYERGGNCE